MNGFTIERIIPNFRTYVWSTRTLPLPMMTMKNGMHGSLFLCMHDSPISVVMGLRSGALRTAGAPLTAKGLVRLRLSYATFIARAACVRQRSYTSCHSKGPFTQAIFVAATQCNFCRAEVATSKPLCDFGAILAIYRRGMRYNSRNTATLRSIFTFKQAHSFCFLH